MTDAATKNTLRAEALRHRARFDPNSEDAGAVVPLFLEHIQPRAGQTIAAYWPMEREFDTRPLLEALYEGGFTCLLPVTPKTGKVLAFYPWTPDTVLRKGAFGIFEPPVTGQAVEPDIVVVPMLAFDRRGYRLGMGQGYYDATLADLRARKAVVAVGMAYAQQACLFDLPAEPHDQRMDWILTPKMAHNLTL